ncbi:N, N'-diacetylbacillosaminyl-diphospho-undecaprenol alpha-1,3-N-acetylgalactosaminyltransferase [Eubacteriaceae bacterium CHKCI005]|nr:N, N'-diacetylbacillosaminyl-diphospho-undecaprenol alpha-1,3-N-acetylgalactosaminyltransferase [Eubacteriaceae bacterium CHKCI005]
MMKKVLLIGNSDLSIYNFRRELVERLLQEGYEVHIAVPYGKKIDQLKAMGCYFVDIPVDRRGTNPVKDLALLKKYIQCMRKIRPDIVLTYTIKPNIYGGLAAQMLGIPYVANITGLGSAVENPGLVQKVTVGFYHLAFRKVDCVFFQNEENRQFFERRGIALGKHKMLPGSGVNLEQFKVINYPSDNTIEFLFIARVMREKGIDEYLETAKTIRKKYPHTRFHVLGFCEEEYERKLKGLQEQGVVEYHGMQRDIRPFVGKSHCTIHPSYYPEGMSNACLESKACGRPVITTTRSGCRETVDDGQTGFLFEAKKTDQLIDRVEYFIQMSNRDRERMGLNARRKVERQFDRRIVVNRYMEEIEQLIG